MCMFQFKKITKFNGLFYLWVYLAFGLKCYVCESRNGQNPACQDPFNKEKVPQSLYSECSSTLGIADATCVKVKSTCKLLVKK